MDTYSQALRRLVSESELVIDRPKGSVHPRYPDYVYPLDYGHLKGTSSADGSGIDVWAGSGDRGIMTGILVIFDPVKKDSEIKILVGCTQAESEMALDCSNRGEMVAFKVNFQGEEV